MVMLHCSWFARRILMHQAKLSLDLGLCAYQDVALLIVGAGLRGFRRRSSLPIQVRCISAGDILHCCFEKLAYHVEMQEENFSSYLFS